MEYKPHVMSYKNIAVDDARGRASSHLAAQSLRVWWCLVLVAWTPFARAKSQGFEASQVRKPVSSWPLHSRSWPCRLLCLKYRATLTVPVKMTSHLTSNTMVYSHSEVVEVLFYVCCVVLCLNSIKIIKAGCRKAKGGQTPQSSLHVSRGRACSHPKNWIMRSSAASHRSRKLSTSLLELLLQTVLAPIMIHVVPVVLIRHKQSAKATIARQ